MIVVDKETGESHMCEYKRIMPAWMGENWGSCEIDTVFLVSHGGATRLVISRNGINFFITKQEIEALANSYAKISKMVEHEVIADNHGRKLARQ